MISRKAQNINPSPTLSITAKAKEMKKSGIDVVSFGAGEPDFDTPDHIKQAAVKALNEGFTKYTPTSGIPELKQAIVAKFKQDNGLEYKPSQVLVSNGAKQVIYNILQVLLNPGDEVIVHVPFWASYEEMIKLADGVCVYLKTKDDFTFDGAMVEKKITPKTRAILFSSPSNPTGAILSKEQLQSIADVCVKHNIYVISDEIYEKLIYGGKKHYSIASLNPEIKKLTVTVNGLSKAYSMTGWRIGYCATDDEAIIKAAGALQDHSTSNPNSIAQKAALAALTSNPVHLKKWTAEFERRRDYMVNRLNNMPGIHTQTPDGAFYVFADVSSLHNKEMKGSDAFCKKVLDDVHVALIPGSAFGDDRYVRLSYATSMEQIQKGMDRLEEFVRKMKK